MGVVFNWSTPTLNAATNTPETAWSLLFPELASYVTQAQASGFFQTAGFFCDNSGSGQVVGGAPYYQLDTFLNYITAHLAKLYASPPGTPPSPLVGRISQATEGSVSVVSELVANPSDQMAFFMQTQYGLTYWTMSQQFRTGFYVPPPCGSSFGAGLAGPAPAYGVFNNGPGFLVGPPIGWG